MGAGNREKIVGRCQMSDVSKVKDKGMAQGAGKKQFSYLGDRFKICPQSRSDFVFEVKFQ